MLYLQPSSLYNLNVKFAMLPLHSPHGKAPHLHASQFSSSEIFYKITSAFLKTGINLRNLPPAHSRGAVTFSGLWPKNYCGGVAEAKWVSGGLPIEKVFTATSSKTSENALQERRVNVAIISNLRSQKEN